jgi:diguanylate cyclase
MTLSREQGLRLAQRVRALRSYGLAAGFLVMAGVFREIGTHPLAWALLVFQAFVWPQLAWQIARRSSDPYKAERRNLVIDSASGGLWIVLMQFNLLPSVLLVVMLTMDKIGIGGTRFLAICAAAQAAALVAAGLLFGFHFNPDTSMSMIIACLPLLIGYPIAVGVSAHRLARRVRQQNRMLAEMSRVDGLTGLFNRLHWEQVLSTEFARRQRSRGAASLLMVDIDHFKGVNDRYGHLVGDEVLRGVAKVLRDTLRQSDAAGRFGGEEFGVLLPDTPVAGALAIAERIRERVAAAALVPGGTACTISIGIAPADGARSHLDWIDRADRALYAAKEQGRNRCVVSEAG